MFQRVRELERQVAQLKQELALRTTERDEAIEVAIAQCHNAVYAAEQGNRKGLVLVR